MALTKLGRVQGVSIFTVASSTSTNIKRNSLTPVDITPMIGDSVLFIDGDVRRIVDVNETSITCGEPFVNIKGSDGVLNYFGKYNDGTFNNLDFKTNSLYLLVGFINGVFKLAILKTSVDADINNDNMPVAITVQVIGESSYKKYIYNDGDGRYNGDDFSELPVGQIYYLGVNHVF